MSQMFVTVAVKDADYVYVPVEDEIAAYQMISYIEAAINRRQTVTFNTRNGRYMVNSKYIVRASYGTLRP